MNTVLSLNSNVKAMNVEIFTKPRRIWTSSLTLVAMFLSFSQWGIGQSCPVAPTISAMVFNPADPCQNVNHDISGITIIPATPGVNYEYRYSLDGGPFLGNSYFGSIPVGPHCYSVQVYATMNVSCGTPLVNYVAGDAIPGTLRTYCIYFGNSGPPAIAANNIAGNTLCVTEITPTPVLNVPCFTYEYSVDGGAWSSVVPIPVTPGCHTLQNRVVCGSTSGGSFGCGAGSPSSPSASTDFVIYNDLSALSDANVLVRTTCASGTPPFLGGSIVAVDGLPVLPTGIVYEYAVAGISGFTTNLSSINVSMAGANCFSITIRQNASCGGNVPSSGSCMKTITFVVFPAAPPAPVFNQNLTCSNSVVPLTVPPTNYPSLPSGFRYMYSVNGGAFTTAPIANIGCNDIVAKITRSTACGNSGIGADSDDAPNDITGAGCSPNSPSGSVTIFNDLSTIPDANIIVYTNCASGAGSVTSLTGLPALSPGLVYWYGIDGGTPSPMHPTTLNFAYGLHSIEFVVKADCNGVSGDGESALPCRKTKSFVVFPAAPTITAPIGTCFMLPSVPSIVGFLVQYSLDGEPFSANPSPTTGGSHTISARYVNQFTGGFSDGTISNCVAESNTVTVMITAPDISITKTNGTTVSIPGGVTTYTITAANAGPCTATVTVTDVLPVFITSATWTAVGAGGATPTSSSTGNINDEVNMPSGSSVTYTVMCNISASASGLLVNSATASPTITDPNPGNNTATDTDVLGIAQIMGGSGYTTLQQAIDAAVDGNTIILLQNITETNLMINKSVILNAGAFSLTASGLTIPAGEYLRWLTNTLTIPATFSITNMGTLWNNGMITHIDPYSNAGTYKGTGTFNGNFTNNGIFSSGN